MEESLSDGGINVFLIAIMAFFRPRQGFHHIFMEQITLDTVSKEIDSPVYSCLLPAEITWLAE